MRIGDIVYISEPQNIEKDVIFVEVRLEPETVDEKETCYGFTATTLEFAKQWMADNKKPYFCTNTPFIIFSKLDDDTILPVIEELLPRINDITKKLWTYPNPNARVIDMREKKSGKKKRERN